MDYSNSRTVVISQSMYFPWAGLFDQIRIADIFVHYDDVQLSRGFYNRVQVKTSSGSSWMSVPLANKNQKQKINQSKISYDDDWIAKHRSLLLNSLRSAKFLEDALSIFDLVHSKKYELLSDLGRASIMSVSDYLGLTKNTEFEDSENISVDQSSSKRLLDLVNWFNGNIYITGLGALNYLDHQLFEASSVEVRYMNYSIRKYTQSFDSFTPYVTILDAIAQLGPDANQILQSSTLNWRDAIERSNELRA